MAVVPADERARADHARQIFTRNSELAIAGGAGREYNGIVERQKLRQLHIAADSDIAEEADAVARKHAIENARHGFRALMIGSDAVTDEPERHRKLFQDVDGSVGNEPQQMIGEITTSRPAADDGNVLSCLLAPGDAKLTTCSFYILVIDRVVVDAAVRRCDPRGHLAVLVDAVHQAHDERAIAVAGQPAGDAAH